MILAMFIDGPARGRELPVGRAPIVLRVTRSPRGMFGVLDGHGDEPAESDDCYPYFLIAAPVKVVDREHSELAQYRLLTPADIPFPPKGTPYLRRWRVFASWIQSHESTLRALHVLGRLPT